MTNEAPNPYIGSRTFVEGERDRFFGRDTEARDLLALVVSERLVVFYAQSGAGKSSLVNTCLIPDLRKRGYEIFTGRVIGDAPRGLHPDNLFVFNLLRSLVVKEANIGYLAGQTISDFLQRHTPANVSDEGEEDRSNLLIIDQFEELFSTHHEAWEKREGFFQQIAQALQDDPYLTLVLVMREDYIASLDPYSPLVPGRFRRRYYMQRLEREAALDAIKRPVENIRPYDDGVAEKLVDDLSSIKIQMADETTKNQPGQFVEGVQLQLVCFKLWKSLEEGDRITNEDLKDLGDVNLALEEHYADRVREVAVQKEVGEREIREWFSKKLITPNGTRNLVLRKTRKAEGELPDDVIQAFQSDLVRAEQRGASTFYELTHDRLVEPILENNRKWFEDDLENLSPLQRQARLWEDEERNEQWLLRGQALADVEMWAKEHIHELSRTESEFLDACRIRQSERQMARERRIARQRNWIIGVTSAIVVALSGLSYFGFTKANEASANASTAIAAQAEADAKRSEAEQETIRADSQKLSANALNQLRTKPDLGILLGIEAYRLNNEIIESRSALFSALEQTSSLRRFLYLDPESSVQVSPGVQAIATFDTQGVMLMDLDGNEIGGPYQGNPSPVYATAFSPDGRILAASGKDGSIILLNMETLQPFGDPLLEHTKWVNTLSFSSDGSLLASVSDDETIILWDITDPVNPTLYGGAPIRAGYGVNCGALSSNDLLATCDSQGTIYLTSVSDPDNPVVDLREILSEQRNMWGDGLAFSSDGNILVSGGFDGTVALWDLSKPNNPSQIHRMDPFGEASSEIESVAIDPAGELVAAGFSDGEIVLWNISRPDLKEPIKLPELKKVHTADVNWLDFSRNGKTLASAGLDGRVVLWDVDTGRVLSQLELGQKINSVTFNPLIDRLIAGSDAGSIYIWDVVDRENPSLIKMLNGYVNKPSRIEMSANGNFLTVYNRSPTGFSVEEYDVVYNVVNDKNLGSGKIIYEDPDGGFLLYEGTDDKTDLPFTMVYDTLTGEAIGSTIPGSVARNGLKFAIDPVDKIVAYETAGGEDHPSIYLWDVFAGKQIGNPVIGEFNGLSRDGSIIACSIMEADRNLIQLIDVKTGNQIGAASAGRYIDIVADDKNLLYESISEESGQPLLVLWNIQNNQMVADPIPGIILAVSQDGGILVYRAADKKGNSTINLVDTTTGSDLVDPVIGNFISLSPNGKTLLYETYDEGNRFIYRLLDVASGVPIDLPIDSESFSTPISTPSLSPDGSILSYQLHNSINDSDDVILFNVSANRTIGNSVRGGSILNTYLDDDVLVYQFDGSTGQQFTVIDVDGPRLIADQIPGKFQTFLQANGDLVYIDGSELKRLNVTTGTSSILSIGINGEFLGISPDGYTLIVHNGDVLEIRNAAQVAIPGTRITEAGSSDAIQTAIPSPDGRKLALLTTDGIILQDAFTGEAIGKPFNGHHDSVSFAGNYPKLSPDGRILAIGDYSVNKVQLWNIETQEKIGDGFPGNYSGFSRDGRILAVGDYTTNLTTLWNVATQEQIGSPSPGYSPIFSPDGRLLAISDYNKNEIALLDLGTQQKIGRAISGSNLAFSPDGMTLAVGDYGSNKIAIWDLTDPATPRSVDNINIPGYLPEFSRDGGILAVGDYNTNSITLWDVATQKEIGSISSGYSPAFSPDGRTLAGRDYSANEITLWDVKTLQKKGAAIPGNNLAFSPDGMTLAVGDYNSNKIAIWDLTDPASPRSVDNINIPGYLPEFGRDGRTLAVGDYNANSSSVWNVDSKNGMASPMIGKAPGEISAMEFSRDGKMLASIGADGVIFTDVETQETTYGPVPGQSVAFSPTGGLFAVSDESNTTFRSIDTGEPIGKPVPGIDPVFDPRGSIVAIRNVGKSTITLWDPDAQKEFYGDAIPGNKVVFSPNGTKVLVFNWVFDGADQDAVNEGTPTPTPVPRRELGITLWNVDRSALKLIDILPVSCDYEGCPLFAAFNPDGKTLAYSDGVEVSLWDIENGKDIGNSIIVSTGLRNLTYILNGQFLALYDSSNLTKIWESSSQSLFGDPFQGSLISDGLNPDINQFLINSGMDWYFWKFDPDDWIDQLCSKVGRDFSMDEWDQYFPGKEYHRTCTQ